jgi:threonine/homoserine/homoserine lactone efflux protein
LLVAMACVTCATLATASIVGAHGVAGHGSPRDRRRSRLIREASGAFLLGTCILLLTHAL